MQYTHLQFGCSVWLHNLSQVQHKLVEGGTNLPPLHDKRLGDPWQSTLILHHMCVFLLLQRLEGQDDPGGGREKINTECALFGVCDSKSCFSEPTDSGLTYQNVTFYSPFAFFPFPPARRTTNYNTSTKRVDTWRFLKFPGKLSLQPTRIQHARPHIQSYSATALPGVEFCAEVDQPNRSTRPGNTVRSCREGRSINAVLR